DYVKRQTRFVSREPPKVITSSIEAVAEQMGLKVHSRNYKMRLQGVTANKAGQFAVVLEVYEVAPALFMVDVRKAAGDTLQYHKTRVEGEDDEEKLTEMNNWLFFVEDLSSFIWICYVSSFEVQCSLKIKAITLYIC
ncbi:hypothetical protein CRG98_000053, partial [Punica granatum]